MALPRTPALATDCVVFDPLAYCSFAAGMNPEAFPWTWAPAYLVRDNDRAYGHAFTSRLRAMGIPTDRSLLDRRGKMAVLNV